VGIPGRDSGNLARGKEWNREHGLKIDQVAIALEDFSDITPVLLRNRCLQRRQQQGDANEYGCCRRL
jgi:hypothetical protein